MPAPLNFPQFRAGSLSPEEAFALNRAMMEVERVANLVVGPPLELMAGGGGYLGRAKIATEFPCSITQKSSVSYGWYELMPSPDGGWTSKPGGLTGATNVSPAFERNLGSEIPLSKVVWMREGYQRTDATCREYLFDYEYGTGAGVPVGASSAVSLGVSTAGNTSGNTGLKYGNFIFEADKGITLSQSTGTGASTLSHTIRWQGPSLGLSTAGNTLGNTGLTWGHWVFEASGASISASQITGTSNTHTIRFLVDCCWPTYSAGTSSGTCSRLTYSNGTTGTNKSFVSFGLDGCTLTAQIAADQLGVPFAISAGTQSVSTGTVIFSNSNRISFGMAGSRTVTADFAAIKIVNAGGSSLTGSHLSFVDSNNIEWGASSAAATNNSGTVTANAQPVLSYWNNFFLALTTATSHGTVMVFPLANPVFQGRMTVSTAALVFSGSQTDTTASSAQATYSVNLGIYTRTTAGPNASVLSLLNSVSGTFSIQSGSDCTTGLNGIRSFTFHSTQWSASPTFSETHYWAGLIIRSAGEAKPISLLGQRIFLTDQNSGLMGTSEATNTSKGWYHAAGIWTATSAGMPGSIAVNALNRNEALAGFAPQLIFNNWATT